MRAPTCRKFGCRRPSRMYSARGMPPCSVGCSIGFRYVPYSFDASRNSRIAEASSSSMAASDSCVHRAAGLGLAGEREVGPPALQGLLDLLGRPRVERVDARQGLAPLADLLQALQGRGLVARGDCPVDGDAAFLHVEQRREDAHLQVVERLELRVLREQGIELLADRPLDLHVVRGVGQHDVVGHVGVVGLDQRGAVLFGVLPAARGLAGEPLADGLSRSRRRRRRSRGSRRPCSAARCCGARPSGGRATMPSCQLDSGGRV